MYNNNICIERSYSLFRLGSLFLLERKREREKERKREREKERKREREKERKRERD